MFFRVLIPVFNSEPYLEAAIQSVVSQTFTDWRLYLRDDLSTDGSRAIIEKYATKTGKIRAIYGDKKRWNGGSRNDLMDASAKCGALYTLFLDGDDVFTDENVFQRIHDIAVTNGYPDCIRLSYNFCMNGGKQAIILNQSNVRSLIADQNVASWTKCVKSDLCARFVEFSLNEDTTHHIAQCDRIRTVVPCLTPCIDWNRDNPKSTSREGSPQRKKWENSFYRAIADVADLELQTDIAEEWRKAKLAAMKREMAARLRSEGY